MRHRRPWASALGTTLIVGLVLTGAPRIARAETALPVLAHEEPASPLEVAKRRAKHLVRVGIGLTLSGVALGVTGIGVMLGPGPSVDNFGNIIGGATIICLGGVFLFAGSPTWIAGEIRNDSFGGPRSLVLIRRWEVAGMVTTLTGLGLSAIGGILVGLSASPNVRDDGGALLISGFTLAPLGVAITLFIGIPMWVEAARAKRQLVRRLVPVGEARAPLARDPHAEAELRQRLREGLPPTTMLWGQAIPF